MLATLSREVALRELDIEHRAVRDLMNTLTDEEKTRPDTIRYGLYPDQKLSFKDLLAHLITYEAFSIEAVDAWKRGEKHFAIDAMQSESGGRKIHYAGIEDRRGQTLTETLDEWEQTQYALMAMIRKLGDDDWKQAAPFATDAPLDLGGVLEIILVAPPRPPYRHLPVHIPNSEAYIRALRAR
ncbi:MAG: hypothetical protein GC179_28830 [Anaerolineaceae bacterium]|nr:hypothetical protein [Anaerolineaceae bacterium]